MNLEQYECATTKSEQYQGDVDTIKIRMFYAFLFRFVVVFN